MNTGTDTCNTAYERLATQIRGLVQDGQVDSDGFIASEYELGRRYELSRVTVRRATELLISSGVIERRPGKGLYVRKPDIKKQKTVWVLVDNFAREPSIRLARGIQNWATQYDFSIQLQDGHAETERNLRLLNELAEREDVDGAIVMAWHTSACFEALCRIKDRGLPFVVIDHHNTQIEFPNVVSDNYHGGWLAAEHLYGLGHRVFGFIGDRAALTVRNRLDGYRDYLAEKGVALPHSRTGDIRAPDHFLNWDAWVEEQMERLFSAPERPTALFVSCDNLVRGVYRYCERNGLVIPRDLSVVGFDDDPLTRWLSPELTTVAQPFSDLGDRAMALLNDQLNGKPWNGKETILPVQFIQRASTQEPRL